MLKARLSMAKALGNESDIAFRTSDVVDAADFEVEMDLVGMLEQDQGYINNRAAIIALMESLTVHTLAEIEGVLSTAAGRQKLFDALALRVAQWCADNKPQAKAILEAMAGISTASVAPAVRSMSPRARSPRSPRMRAPFNGDFDGDEMPAYSPPRSPRAASSLSRSRSPSSDRDLNDYGSFSSSGDEGSGYYYNGNTYRYRDQAGMRGL